MCSTADSSRKSWIKADSVWMTFFFSHTDKSKCLYYLFWKRLVVDTRFFWKNHALAKWSCTSVSMSSSFVFMDVHCRSSGPWHWICVYHQQKIVTEQVSSIAHMMWSYSVDIQCHKVQQTDWTYRLFGLCLY